MLDNYLPNNNTSRVRNTTRQLPARYVYVYAIYIATKDYLLKATNTIHFSE